MKKEILTGRRKAVSQLALALSLIFGAQTSFAAAPSLEEKLEILQKEIEEIKAELARNKQQVQSPAPSPSQAAATDTGYSGFKLGNTTLGGYGEAIYNKFTKAGNNDQFDLRRVVLFVGHKFNNRLRFQSEIEFEHAKTETGAGGAVEVEQAYIEYGLTQNHNLRAGLVLVPSGILNETHEPTTFYGVERNRVETVIIPAIWRELGAGLQGRLLPGLEYNIGGVTSLDTGRFTEPENGIRETRSEGSLAPANDLAVYAALNYRGIPGLLLGTSVFTGNTGQNGASNPALAGVNARVT
ncbi:MAG: porin, partial [Burkholderiales bacterium]